MSKIIKAMVSDELRSRFSGFSSACVVDMTGMNVQEQQELRGRLLEKSARVEVVKNSLARRALKDGPLEPLGSVLAGPCALITAKESLIDVAKLLVEAAKEFEALKLKEAIFDGDSDLLSIQELSKMKSQQDLIGEIAMLLSSPGRSLAGCLGSPQAKIAGCLKAMIEKAA
jgi:large subunit ribosomal protein L10